MRARRIKFIVLMSYLFEMPFNLMASRNIWASNRDDDDLFCWDVTPCSFVYVYKNFGITCCLHLRIPTLKMEGGGSSYTKPYPRRPQTSYYPTIYA
jgi:hypothetical protein